MSQHSAVLEHFARRCDVSPTMDKHLNDLLNAPGVPKLSKTIPPANSGLDNPVGGGGAAPQRAAAGEAGQSPIFGPLVAAGLVIDGLAAAPEVGMHLGRHVREHVAYGHCVHRSFGKRASSASQSQSQTYSNSGYGDNSQSKSKSDELERVASEIDGLVKAVEREVTKQLGKARKNTENEIETVLESSKVERYTFPGGHGYRVIAK